MKTHLKIAQYVSDLLENKFSFMGRRFGIDPLLGLLPGLGDFLGLVFSFYLVWIGSRMQLPKDKINLMLQNIVLDFMFGIIPFVGDMSDFVFKANTRNMAILRKYEQNPIIDGNIV
ncbi:MAG: DUF4112 domain-containing protein [bacterium]|nr:DUF4112 domain-containing protein [bacterium]